MLRFGIGLLAASLVALPTEAQPRPVPARVSLRVPPCTDGPIDWRTLTDALTLELRTVGSDLGEGAAEAELTLSGPCAGGEPVRAVLRHVDSGRQVEEQLADAAVPVRELALTLSELVRARWAGLARAPTPPPTPTVDPDVVDAAVRAALAEVEPPRPPEPTPPPPPPGALFEVGLGGLGHPAGGTAYGNLSVGASVPVGLVRLRARVFGRLGYREISFPRAVDMAARTLTLGGFGGAIAAALRASVSGAEIEAGPAVEIAWHAAAPLDAPGTLNPGRVDRAYTAALLEVGVTARLAPGVWLRLRSESGVVFTGLHLRDIESVDGDPGEVRLLASDGGIRIGLGAGLAFSL